MSSLTAMLQLLPPETAHKVTIQLTKYGSSLLSKGFQDQSLHTNVKGLSFSNPLGIAAGFDKNAELIDPLLKIGFGFVECGTVTPLPQFGNTKPRVFRLKKDNAIINRLGFNNKGEKRFVNNLMSAKKTGIVGSNIGPNKDSKNFIDDYLKIYRKISISSDYVTINVSSPNTEALRELQRKEYLEVLLREISQIRDEENNRKPIMLKIDPDNTNDHYSMILNLVNKYNIDGIIATNTSLSRPEILRDLNKKREGGLSGTPIREISDKVLKFLYQEANNELILIGVGGVGSALDVYSKIKLGASLVQMYTSLTYGGPRLINKILIDLVKLIKDDGFTNISEAVGVNNK
jgi:dihydroorotate dehydrogenase